MKRIALLDGCAGIGGNSFAFHSFAETRLYSEVDPGVADILRCVIKNGFIDEAPIAGDITKIELEGSLDMLTAGFPCQGNSRCGHGLGLEDARSGIIKGIFERIAVWKPKFVFLENVPEVLRNGSARYVADKFIELGYVTAWGVIGAEHVGFQHQRLRWFCLGAFPEHLPLLAQCVEVSKGHTLARQTAEPARMQEYREVNRIAALGNGVVPQAAKLAFEMLSDVLLKPPSEAPIVTYGTNLHYVPWAYFDGSGDCFQLPEPQFPGTRFTPLTLRPDAYVHPGPPSARCTSGFLSEPIEFAMWATPRHGNTGACNFLTKRGCRDLHTQVRFEQATTLREGSTSPRFLEFLMGYPCDYTAA